MPKKLKNIILMITCLVTSWSFSQGLPMQVSAQMIPPYSLKLSDYTTAMNERIVATLLLTDVREQNMQIGIRMYIENGRNIAIRSSPAVMGATPLYISGGTPLRLSNLDLRPYFQLENLHGISPQQYNQPLPDGLYQFCFEVYEWVSGETLSRKSCATAYLVLNDPPILNFPNKGELIAHKDPQNIIFQWTPRHLNATNVQYEFTLTELWDIHMDPQAAFLASRPLYQTTTRANTLLYGPGETALLPDKTYAWRVKALVSDGISETSVFKNGGYSEIFHFTHTGNCDEPAFILAKADSPTSEKIMWQGLGHLKYKIQFRKKASPSDSTKKGRIKEGRWHEINSVNEYVTLYNLEGGNTYEFRVGGQCNENAGYTYSQIYEFTTAIPNQALSYNCGITPEIEITNRELLQSLAVNDVFTAGDFPVTVTSVNPSPFGGGWVGAGYIVVPYLQDTKVRVSFNNIKINTDYQFIEGVIETEYDPSESGMDDTRDEIASISQAFNNIENLLNNWAGSEEDIQQLVAQQAYINDEIEGALNGNVLSEDEINNIKKDKSGFDQSVSNLIEEGSNPSNENINAVRHTKDKLKEYELGQSLENDSQEPITGDGYFDGILKFSVPDKEITKTNLDNPIHVDIEALKSKDEEGEEYFNAAWNNLKPGKTLIVSASNKISIDDEEDIRKIKQQFANIGFNEYLLWIHYDFKLNEIKYKVDFGEGYYSGTDITKNELTELYNTILTFDLKEAIGSSIVQVSESMDTLLEEYKAYIPQLNKELIAGYNTYDVLKMIVEFQKTCGENFKTQENGIVPRCLWDNENPLTLSAAYSAGFIDAAWEIGELGVTIYKLKESWDPLSPYFNTEEAAVTRQQTIEVLLVAVQLLIDPAKMTQAWETVKVELERYVDETLDINAQARYNQGKLIFEVATTIFGIAEVKAFIKTGKITSNMLQGMAKVSVNLARLFKAIPGKLKKLENNVLAYILSANMHIEIARYTDDGVITFTKWVDEPAEILEQLGEITYKKADDATTYTDELVIVKDKSGNLGLKLLANAVSDFANYVNIRKYLGDSRVKQYLKNSEIYEFEKTIRKAHPDVLKYMDDMDEFDFAEMVRGYRDLRNEKKLSTFENAIKSGDNFYGKYNGWLKYWLLTPGMKYSLTTIKDLRNANKLLPTGAATDIELASIQSFTRKGDFINRPLRYENNTEFMGEYATKGLQYIKNGFDALRKVPSRLVKGEKVFSGKAFSKADFEKQFVDGIGSTIEYKSFISTSKLESVAEEFTKLTKKWAGTGERVGVIQRITTKNGVYIDDLSDWGKHLGPTRHSDAEKVIQIQEEVVLNPGLLKQVTEPIPIIENGIHKEIDGMKLYYVDFIEQIP